METMTVHGLGGDRYVVSVRGHRVVVDQPPALGGGDTAPTPTELFLAGLASCVAFYAGRYCDRHAIARDGLAVDLAWQLSEDRPARVGSIEVTVTPPGSLPPERLPGFLAVARGCTVHHTLEDPPHVGISVTEVAPVDDGAEVPAAS